MRLIVDTSAYSAFKRGHDGVRTAIRRAERLYLNPVILGELFAGFERGDRAPKNHADLESFLASPRAEVVAIDRETSESYATILNHLRSLGKPIPTNDIWIAATAMQHGLRVLTTDAHFQRVVQIRVEFHALS